VNALRNWFVLSARDLRMQKMTVDEIAEAMRPVSEASIATPICFAQKVRLVLEDERAEARGVVPIPSVRTQYAARVD